MPRATIGLCLATLIGVVESRHSLQAQPRAIDRAGALTDRHGTYVTITGCLERNLDGEYILTDAQVGTVEPSASGSRPISTIGSVWKAKPGKVQNDVPWTLEGRDDLIRHLLQRIEVTGPIASDIGATSRASGTSGRIGSTTANVERGPTRKSRDHRLIVKTVKVALANCI